jgi:hypothetical protein
VKTEMRASGQAMKTTATPMRKTMLYKPVIHTARSARSGFPAPRFWPTRVATAFVMPQDGSIATTMMRSAMV